MFFSVKIAAQLETTTHGGKKGSTSGILAINAKKSKKPVSIKVDATDGFKNAYKNKKKTKKQLDRELNNKGIITQAKINEERFLKAFKKINGVYQYPKIDQDLGSFRTQSKHVKIICRDFGAIDGDRVTIHLNGLPVIPNISLTSNYQAFTVALDVGVNTISFVALNQGTSGPNTADFKVYNDAGSLISANEWNLATGAKASLVIVKTQ